MVSAKEFLEGGAAAAAAAGGGAAVEKPTWLGGQGRACFLSLVRVASPALMHPKGGEAKAGLAVAEKLGKCIAIYIFKLFI